MGKSPEMTPKTMAGHSHHWKIEGPNGPRSTARCKKCGTEREFSNVHPLDDDASWKATAIAGAKAIKRARHAAAVHSGPAKDFV